MRIWSLAAGLALALAWVTPMIAATSAPAVSTEHRPPCAQISELIGKPIEVQGPLSETDRLGWSAAIVLALTDKTGAAAWPDRSIEKSSGCEVGGFDVRGVRFTAFAAGDDDNVVFYWATSAATPRFAFVAMAPGISEAHDWHVGKTTGIAIKTPTFLLVVVRDELRYITKIYDEIPPPVRILEDMAAALGESLPLFAIYDIGGDAVSISEPTQSHLQSVLFRDLPYRGRPATIFGADGRQFEPNGHDGVVAAKARFPCPATVGRYALERLQVLDSSNDRSDLGCRYDLDDDWISVFITFKPGARLTERVFQLYLKEALKADKGAQQRRGIPDILITPTPKFGASWMGSDGNGEGIWMSRHGDYNIEVRATFNDKAAAAEAVEAIYRSAVGEAKIAADTAR